nr:ANTAR domain-containing protein [Polymorphobacter sp.]
MTAKPLRIAIIDESPARAAVLEDGLREAGLTDIHLITERFQLLRQVADIAPDVVLIDLESPRRDVLDEMFAVSRAVARPIAMFVDQSDASMMEAAIDAGVSAYVVDGLRKERIKAVLDLSIARFNAFRRLQDELHEARSALADRKVIDRAKVIVMKQRGLDEDAAYALLRSAAMQQSRRIAEIATALVTAESLLGPGTTA